MVLGSRVLAKGDREIDTTDPVLTDTVLAIVASPARKVDTVARLSSFKTGRKRVRVVGEPVEFSVPGLLATHDQAVLFQDGVMAIVFWSPYRVELRSASGKLMGRTAPDDRPTPVTPQTKRALAAAFKSKPDGSPFFTPDDFPGWPRVLPPFLPGSMATGPNGHLYVTRIAAQHDAQVVVDVFDRTPTRIAQISIPVRSRLVGVGQSGLYVAETDNVGAEHLGLVRFAK